MSDVRTIVKNITALSISQFVTVLLGFVTTIMIARSLGDVEFGRLSFAQSFTTILVVFADVGLSNLAIRELARRKAEAGRYITNIALTKVLLTALTLGLIAIAAHLMGYSLNDGLIIYLVGISLLINSFSMFIRSVYRAFEKMEYEAYINILISVVKFGLIIAVLSQGYGLVAVGYCYVFIEAVNLLLSSAVAARKFPGPELRFDTSFSRQMILDALPFFASSLIVILYFRIDVVILSMISGDAAVGQYNAACLIVYTLLNIPNVVSFSIYPVMSRLYVSAADKLKVTIDRLTKYSLLVAVPITIVLMALAGFIIGAVYGPEYAGAVIALQVLSLYIPVKFVNYVIAYTLSSVNREGLRALSSSVAVLTNVVLNLALIPYFSLTGSAIAMVLTEVVLFLCYYYCTAKCFYRIPIWKILWKPLILGVAILVFMVYSRDSNAFLIAAASLALYTLSLFLLNTFDEYDRDLFEKSIRGLKALGR